MNVDNRVCQVCPVCPVCLEDIVVDDLCQLNCDHEICKPCLDTLLTMKKTSCPLCRRNIPSFNHKGQMNHIIIIRYNPTRGSRVIYVDRNSVYLTILSAGSSIGFIGSLILNVYLYGNR
jgi:hypothetical protein